MKRLTRNSGKLRKSYYNFQNVYYFAEQFNTITSGNDGARFVHSYPLFHFLLVIAWRVIAF